MLGNASRAYSSSELESMSCYSCICDVRLCLQNAKFWNHGSSRTIWLSFRIRVRVYDFLHTTEPAPNGADFTPSVFYGYHGEKKYAFKDEKQTVKGAKQTPPTLPFRDNESLKIILP